MLARSGWLQDSGLLSKELFDVMLTGDRRRGTTPTDVKEYSAGRGDVTQISRFNVPAYL